MGLLYHADVQDVTGKSLILYDGVCALCNRLVRFTLRRDRRDRFRYATLQSQFAGQVLARHRASADALDSVLVVLDYGTAAERLLQRSDATVAALRELGGRWAVAARLLALLPRRLRNLGYNFVARRRYQVFGRYTACPLPPPAERHKFLGLE